METIELKPIDILYNPAEEIIPFVERVRKDMRVSNVLILVCGLPQSGKTNTALYFAEQISKNFISTFRFDVFKKESLDFSYNKVIVYDEVQQDIKNWWDDTYFIMKQILESYGMFHHVVFIITPLETNIHSLIKLCHYIIRTERIYNRKKRKYEYFANIYKVSYSLVKAKINLICFETDRIPRCSLKIWEKHQKLKEENLKHRIKTWKFTKPCEVCGHKDYRYSTKKNYWICRTCGNITKTNPFK
jgi:cytidylate kinase/ribosomal protein S14